MKGTTTIKKNNAIDHIKNLLVHQIAVLCVTEKKNNVESKIQLFVLPNSCFNFCISNI